MDKGKLTALSREALIERAEALGVRRARFLTRPELVDEILLAESKVEGDKRGVTRGMFGVARDLLARLVERGLHLPDAAERIRGANAPPRPRMQASSIPTVTLAEIYAAQGHHTRAVETLERLLREEPDHEEAQQMLERLRKQAPAVEAEHAAPAESSENGERAEDANDAVTAEVQAVEATTVEVAAVLHASLESSADEGEAAADSSVKEANTEPDLPTESDSISKLSPESDDTNKLPPESGTNKPITMLDDGPLPPRYDVDECVALPVDPRTVFVYWELREATVRNVIARVGAGGTIALRVAVLEPTWDGPTYSRFEHDVHVTLGEYFLRELPEGAVVRVAVGYRAPNGELVPLAHSELFEAANAERAAMPSPVLYSWSPSGMTPVERSGREAAFLAEALHASRAPDLQQLALKYGATALGTWRSAHEQFLGSSAAPPR